MTADRPRRHALSVSSLSILALSIGAVFAGTQLLKSPEPARRVVTVRGAAATDTSTTAVDGSTTTTAEPPELTDQERQAAVDAFNNDPTIKSMYADAGEAPSVREVHRTIVGIDETLDDPAKVAMVETDAASADLTIPDPHPRPLFRTRTWSPSNTEAGYDSWQMPCSYTGVKALDVFVDLRSGTVVGIAPGSTDSYVANIPGKQVCDKDIQYPAGYLAYIQDEND